MKSVGRFGLGELAKCMIQGNLRGLKGSETIGFSHSADILNSSFEREFYWTFDHERGEFPTSTVSHFPDDV